MMRVKVPILLLITSLILLVLLCGCDLTKLEVFQSVKSVGAEETSDKVTIWEYRYDIVERVTTADKIERYHKEKKLIAYNVVITDYNPDKTVKMRLDANEITIEEIKKIYTAIGNVVIEREDSILKTEHLVWNQTTDEIFSPIEVTIIRGENILRGIELKSNIEFSYIELKKVTAEGTISDEDISW